MWEARQQKMRWVASIAAIVLLVFGGSAQAANKALLIATTEYADPLYDLPGLSYDIEEMDRFARKLGFTADNIKTLTGNSVTRANIEAEFSGYLTNDVGPSDKVFIYYSGHGLQVPDISGDEDDERDEALSLYDLAPSASGWDGVLLDDQFAALLRGLKSDNVMVVVDACHSGTVTRSFTVPIKANTRAYGEDDFAVKALAYRGKSTRSFGKSVGTVTDELPSGVVSLSAAQDHEQSLASKKGSLFTLALVEALEIARNVASPQALMQTATNILSDKLDADYLFTPNLSGDEDLFTESVVIEEAKKRSAVNWSDLSMLSSRLLPLSLTANQAGYAYETPIELMVEVPTNGYINIVAVDAADEMVVLFPNGIDTNNEVEAGKQQFPGDRSFSWVAQPPWGSSMIVVLFSTTPVNLFDSSIQRSRSGAATADFVLPTLSAFEIFKQKRDNTSGGSVIIETCETELACG